jgi:hypothetical protein
MITSRNYDYLLGGNDNYAADRGRRGDFAGVDTADPR